MLRTRSVFVIGILAGFAAVFALSAANRPPPHMALVIKHLSGDIWVSEQIGRADFASLAEQHFKSIIDLRPDGEAPDQPPSVQIARFARQQGMAFAYVPVPHGDVPSETVEKMSASLASAEKPVLLYCRSGRRAARTWALAEASRSAGMDAAAIEEAVRSVGQTPDDLHELIVARIAARASAGG
jgi:uncharacterized protein (TIGR01244 family)